MVTARQLDELHKAAGGKGQVVLPYRARLTPMASDWVRSKSVTIGYSDATAQKPVEKEKAPSAPAAKAGDYLWWCDGPCGQIKAAIAMEAKQAGMRQIEPPAAPCPLMASKVAKPRAEYWSSNQPARPSCWPIALRCFAPSSALTWQR